MKKSSQKKNSINLVVHESALPKGRGWSPLTWQILEGINEIPISLLEVDEKVDSGKIFLRDKIKFQGHELINELRLKQAEYTFKLCKIFIEEYPKNLKTGKSQAGRSTYYKKRTPEDSKIDVDKSIKDNFNLLRTVDNSNYPAFFNLNGKKYKLKIEEY